MGDIVRFPGKTRYIIMACSPSTDWCGVLWANRWGKLFWVQLKTSKLLRHSGVQFYLNYKAALTTVETLGGSVAFETQLHQEVPRKARG